MTERHIVGSIFDLPRVYREAIAMHDIIQTFGVPASKIFVARGKTPTGDTPHLFVVAKGDKDFSADVGPLSESQEEFEEIWNRAVQIYNNTPRAERARLLDLSDARDRAVDIVAGLVMQGFKPRSFQEARS